MFLVKPLIIFLRHSIGTVFNPYETFREMSLEEENLRQTLYFHLLIFVYFLLTSLLKTGFRNPFLLTVKFNTLYFSSYLGFVLMISLFFIGFRLLKNNDFPLPRTVLLWSYSLWPTLIWFFVTSLMYLILPPPRTLSYPGKIYSLSYLVFSLTLLFWKFILYYLTLRFALRIDLYKISLISLLILPVVFLYSFVMYRLGIFKIPFL